MLSYAKGKNIAKEYVIRRFLYSVTKYTYCDQKLITTSIEYVIEYTNFIIPNQLVEDFNFRKVQSLPHPSNLRGILYCHHGGSGKKPNIKDTLTF